MTHNFLVKGKHFALPQHHVLVVLVLVKYITEPQKVEAIKHLRKFLNISLYEAKSLADYIEEHGSLSSDGKVEFAPATVAYLGAGEAEQVEEGSSFDSLFEALGRVVGVQPNRGNA